jgi:hypothetical protein
MPRYFFNIIVGAETIPDFEGTDLPDIGTARTEAVMDARSLMSTALLEGWDISERSIQICGDTSEVILTVAFRDTVRRQT